MGELADHQTRPQLIFMKPETTLLLRLTQPNGIGSTVSLRQALYSSRCCFFIYRDFSPRICRLPLLRSILLQLVYSVPLHARTFCLVMACDARLDYDPFSTAAVEPLMRISWMLPRNQALHQGHC